MRTKLNHIIWCFLISILIITGCGGHNATSSLNSANSQDDTLISAYTINGVAGTFTGKNIILTLPYGTDRSSLVASFLVPSGEILKVGNVVQESGITPNDFRNPVVYTVISGDTLSRDSYTVTVRLALLTVPPSATMSAFSLNGVSGTISGNTISVTMPHTTDVTALTATYTVAAGAIVSGGSNNFTAPVIYTVTSSDGSISVDYTVTVLLDTTFATFSLNGTAGVISGDIITVPIPPQTDITDLVATYTTVTPVQDVSVIVFGTPTLHTSGVTSNEFNDSTPMGRVSKNYVITSLDSTTTATYRIDIPSSSELSQFTIHGKSYTIVQDPTVAGNATIHVRAGTADNISALEPRFTLANGVNRVRYKIGPVGGGPFVSDGCGIGAGNISGTASCPNTYDFATAPSNTIVFMVHPNNPDDDPVIYEVVVDNS